MTMRALVLQTHGGLENFIVRDIAKPELRQNQVLVRVAAASLNQIENSIRLGLPIGPELPAVLGCDFAGVVENVGSGVLGFKVGEEVYGCSGGIRGTSGSLAEYIAADGQLIARKPTSISMRHAAALPMAGIAAWDLIERVRIRPNDHVLIHGATGDVGHLAVQLASHFGARVAVTVDEGDEHLAKSLGADDIILRKKETPSAYAERLTGGKGFSAIIDTIGGDHLDESFQAAAAFARISTTATRTNLDLSPMHFKGITLSVVFVLLPLLANTGTARYGRILRQIAKLVDEGQLSPLLHDDGFTLKTVPQAYQMLASGKIRGKAVVDVAANDGLSE
jgi:NADPH:quinone reductase